MVIVYIKELKNTFTAAFEKACDLVCDLENACSKVMSPPINGQSPCKLAP